MENYIKDLIKNFDGKLPTNIKIKKNAKSNLIIQIRK